MFVTAVVHARRMTPPQPTPWEQLLRAQSCVATRKQLREQGFTDRTVQRRLRSGAWQRICHGVYATTSGPLVREALLSAALLYGGPYAVLSHRSAGEEWRMLPPDTSMPVHITLPYSMSAVTQPAMPGRYGVVHPGVVVHRSRAYRHIVVATEPPRTSRADTVLDLAVAEPTAREAGRRLVALTTGNGVRLPELRSQLELRRPRRYRRVLTGSLTLMADGVQSALEHRYATDVERSHGLPTGRRQSHVVVDGRTLWEDVDYPEYGAGLIVRLDGRKYHWAAEPVFTDRRRDNAAELRGRPRLVYGWEEVTVRTCRTAHEVATVLRRNGWTGEAVCSSCS